LRGPAAVARAKHHRQPLSNRKIGWEGVASRGNPEVRKPACGLLFQSSWNGIALNMFEDLKKENPQAH